MTVMNSFVAVEGPKKKEVAQLAAVNSGDTYVSTLQNPEFGYFVPVSPYGAARVDVIIVGRMVTVISGDLVDCGGVLTLYGF